MGGRGIRKKERVGNVHVRWADQYRQAPLYPLYSDVGHAIRLLDGESVQRVRDMLNAIFEQTGTPQNPVDWSDPDAWINERLSGELLALARKIWDGSGKALKPRYLNGCYLFINRLRLLERDAGVYRIDKKGRQFLASDGVAIVEGIVDVR